MSDEPPSGVKTTRPSTVPTPLPSANEAFRPDPVEEMLPPQSKSRFKRMLDHVSFNKKKATGLERSSAKNPGKHMRSQTKALEESEIWTRRSQPEADEKTGEEQRRASIERAEKYRKDKKSQQAQEKRTREYYTSGMFWGFDPGAGKLRSERDDAGAVRSGSDMDRPFLTPSDILLTKPKRGETWGVQHGQPKKLDTFGVPINFRGAKGRDCESPAESD
ncbi:hypothetical protein LTR10_014423 [Elasticomyces elasticus]|uniref:Uncharacterized protein n=1 Tax=Exophiala sideris TaxID=1016849 RepID=A0ABR0J1N1_9EURO|nr:hypothetical protein LTR10_014423 [Elasticomyces elasticus]KAK5023663.1 hypothetical protein LTS07_009171 [Exophiala sideris]KAK5029663.1 hypothetical protein LTR13_008583 [Exophiala sideris]KAK5053452.1 hypothetical protein LTR69_009410 [Exophiala sideris]KAK5179210.1 hypothetical protein LTR44_008364 [Eurotiomycetes sp. CCFEE 6388]